MFEWEFGFDYEDDNDGLYDDINPYADRPGLRW